VAELCGIDALRMLVIDNCAGLTEDVLATLFEYAWHRASTPQQIGASL
jgi:hypothetical protein